MASKAEALVRNFLKTDGDALYLVPGERIFLMRGVSKVVVGREPLSEESFRAVAAELVPGTTAEALAEARYALPFQPDAMTPVVEVHFTSLGGTLAMMVRRAPEPVAAEDDPYAGAGGDPQSAMDAYEQREAAAQAGAAYAPTPAGAYPATAASAPAAAPAYRPPPPPKPAPPAAPETVEALDVPDELSGKKKGAGPTSVVDEIEAPTLSGKKKQVTVAKRASSGKPLDDVLTRMLDLNASDAHLAVSATPIFRIHGELVPQTDTPNIPAEEFDRQLQTMMPDRARKEFLDRNDTDFAYEIAGVGRFRVNVFRDRVGVSVVVRAFPAEVPGPRALGLPPGLVELGSLTRGLVVVTGPAGSGKSTTLAVLADFANATRGDHLITIESPIEFVHKPKKCLVHQREVLSHTRSFASAIRAAQREDAGVVVVSDLREPETLEAALELADMGHLVLGALFTPSATVTVDRLLEAFPAERLQPMRVLLADVLRAVVAQTLCRKISGGRVAAFEVLLGGGAVATLIRDGKTFQIPSVLQTQRSQGMILLNDSLLDLVKRGVVDPKEALQKAADKAGLTAALRSSGIAVEG